MMPALWLVEKSWVEGIAHLSVSCSTRLKRRVGKAPEKTCYALFCRLFAIFKPWRPKMLMVAVVETLLEIHPCWQCKEVDGTRPRTVQGLLPRP